MCLCSGASALTYEVLWTRQLTLTAGATAPAVSTVLAVFMGGLALGARIFGPVADRARRLLRWYGALELGIGAFALLQPALLAWTGRLYLGIVQQAGPQGSSLLGLRVALAALLLLVPTVLMGGTLPILVRVVSREESRFGHDLGTLYAINLAGAVIGSGMTGFVLIRYLGLHGTLVAAVVTSVAIGCTALVLSARVDDRTQAASGSDVDTASVRPFVTASPLPALLWMVVGLSGFLTMAYQVAWTRMLVFSFDSTIYSFTLTLVVFLAGLALGSVLFARLDRRVGSTTALMAANFIAAASALALAPIAAHLRGWIDALSAQWGYTARMQLAGTAAGNIAVMLLPATLMGIVFPLATRALIQNLGTSGKRLGNAYWVNTVGSIAGALLTGFVLVPLLSVKNCLLALAGIQTLLALGLLPWTRLSRRAAAFSGVGGAAVVLILGANFLRLLPGPNPFDWLPSVEGIAPVIEAHKDDAAASVTVVRDPEGDRSLRINGFVAAADSKLAGYMPMMSHLPMLLRGAGAQRVLVICFGTGSTAGAALLHPDAKVDVVEINPTVLRYASWFDRANHQVYRNPRAKLIVDDGRNYLAATRERYDVITSEPMPPTHAGVVNLYSREYYALARERLKDGGLLVQWLPFHLVTFDESQSILRTVQDVFPDTTVWLHSTTGLIVARKGAPVSLDWAAVSKAFDVPDLAQDLKRLQVSSPAELAQLFALGPAAVRDLAGDAAVITDDRPSLEFHPPRHRLPLVFGGHTADSARMMLEIYARWGSDGPPIENLPAGEGPRLAQMRRVRNAVLVGILSLDLGRGDQAESAFTEALRLASTAEDRALSLYNLAAVQEARGNRREALSFAARALEQAPGSQSIRDLVARLQAPAESGDRR